VAREGIPRRAHDGIHGLSQLNVWWMRLGIQHQRIRPASPQGNGAHGVSTRPSRRVPAARRASPSPPSSAPSIAFGASPTTNGRTSSSVVARPAPATPRRDGPFPTGFPRSSIRATSWSSASPTPARSASTPAALHRQRAQTASHRARRNRRRHHPREVLPILPVYSVTHQPGCSRRYCHRSPAVQMCRPFSEA